MNIAEKYSDIVRQINVHINSFNAFLVDEYKIKIISTDDPSTFSEIVNGDFDKQRWPSGSNYGVYILCECHEFENTNFGIYIGKSSLQGIGDRLWRHLNPYRKDGVYRNPSNESFIIEAVLAIPIIIPKMHCFASALEEYIIKNSLVGVHVFNKVGNKK